MLRHHFIRRFASIALLLIFLQPGTRAERLPVKIFTSADGLGSSFVDYVMRDARGFIWFCTRDGLTRFDGSRFINYQITDVNSPPGIETIYQTKDGDYWVGTTGGLYRFHPNAVSHPSSANRNGRPILQTDFIGAERGNIFEDQHGEKWYGGDGLFQLNLVNGKYELQAVALNLPAPRDRFVIIEISGSADGSLWLDTTTGLMRRLPDGRVVLYSQDRPLTQENVSIMVDRDGLVWWSRPVGLEVIRPEPIESIMDPGPVIQRAIPDAPNVQVQADKPVQLPQAPGETFLYGGADLLTGNLVRKIFQSSDGQIWLTTEKMLLEFDGKVFKRFTTEQGLQPKMARIAEDMAGNLWFGGQSGVIRLDRRSIRTYGVADGLNSANVQAIQEAPDGTLYFANGMFYLSQFDGTGLKTIRPGVTTATTPIWTSRYSLLDSKGNWWFLTREKLFRFSGSNLKHPAATFTTADGLRANDMFQIFEDREGDIWVSQQPGLKIEDRGLSRLEPGANKFYSYSEAEGYPKGKSVSSFAEDAKGRVWTGFYEGGLARFDQGHFTVFTAQDGLPPGLITDILIDHTGRLWLASTGGGVCIVDDPLADRPKLRTLTINDGLSSNNLRTMTEDHFGNVYLGTVRGVDWIPPGAWQVNHISVNDGLAGDFVVDSHCDKNGDVWFATTTGISRLVPSAEMSRPPPDVWLGGLRIAGVAQPVSELGQSEIGPFELGHNQNTLQLDFFGLEFNSGESLLYQYKLEGAAGDWSTPSEQRTLTLANLQPGTYRLLVRAVSANGQLSLNPATVTFRILSPIWLRWWFLALVLLLIAAVIVTIYRYRIARLREVNSALQAANRAAENLRLAKEERLAELERVRSRIATDLHDDIGASLTQIAILSEVAQQQTSAGIGSANGAAAPLEKIYHVSTGLVATMGDIVWAINPRKDHLSDLVQRMRRFASDVLSAKEIDFEFKAPAADANLALGANVRREVFLIFKEAINNIVKHSNAKVVGIDFGLANGRIHLGLADDGIGFVVPADGNLSGANAYDDEPGGNGLFSMQRRAAELGGNLSIVSTPGKGTVLTLDFRLPEVAEQEPATTRMGSDGNRQTN